MINFVLLLVPFFLYILSVWVAYSSVRDNLESVDEMDMICWAMVFMPIGNIGWAIGAMVQSELDNKKEIK